MIEGAPRTPVTNTPTDAMKRETMSKPLRILIVDDSALMRRVLREMLESDREIRVIGEATNGLEALQLAKDLKPDVITMDVMMPVMDGVETTEQLMAYNPTPILVVTGTLSRNDIDVSFAMLGAGALEVIEKPDLSDAVAVRHARTELIRRVKALSRVRVVTHLRGRRSIAALRTSAVGEESAASRSSLALLRAHESLQAAPSSAPSSTTTSPASSPKHFSLPHFETTKDGTKPSVPLTPPTRSTTRRIPQHDAFPLIMIGSSTGGPRIVRQILMGLPSTLGAAVVVVQHIAQGFSHGMAEWLAADSQLPVRLAAEGDVVRANQVLVAPDSLNLLIRRGGTVHLSDQPCLMRPAVDIAMQTAAEVFGDRTIGVLLTGMGRDGALGMQAIYRVGGHTIAQNEATCTIYGMPRAAIELDVVHEVLSPERIIESLRRHSSKWMVSA